MTCIVGLVHKGVIYMGGDSAATGDTDVRIRLDPKVFILDKRFVIGFTSSYRMGQLLQFSFKPAKQLSPQTDYQYMCTTFIDAVRKCFRDGGYMGEDKEDGGREEGGQFLVGYKGVLYEIYNNFQVAKNRDSYSSVGCGEDYAHGSLFATEGLRMSPRKRITAALEAAVHFSTGVEPPFIIERLAAPKKRKK